MVTVCKTLKRVGVILTLFFSFWGQAQDSGSFNKFGRYKSWGLYLSPKVYDKTRISPYYGNYSPTGHYSITPAIGVSKQFRSEKKISFRTGIFADITPYYNFTMSIYPNDHAYATDIDATNNRFRLFERTYHVPLVAQIKSRIGENLFFNIEAGAQIAIMPLAKTGAGGMSGIWDENKQEGIMVFDYYTASDRVVFANAILSSGVFYTHNKFLLQFNVIFQKTTTPYFQGEYVYDNLTSSPRSMGSNKLRGDYLGLSLSIYPLKKEFRKKKGG